MLPLQEWNLGLKGIDLCEFEIRQEGILEILTIYQEVQS